MYTDFSHYHLVTLVVVRPQIRHPVILYMNLLVRRQISTAVHCLLGGVCCKNLSMTKHCSSGFFFSFNFYAAIFLDVSIEDKGDFFLPHHPLEERREKVK